MNQINEYKFNKNMNNIINIIKNKKIKELKDKETKQKRLHIQLRLAFSSMRYPMKLFLNMIMLAKQQIVQSMVLLI